MNSQFYLARKTITEMINDRGYYANGKNDSQLDLMNYGDLNKINIDHFKNNNSILDIYATYDDINKDLSNNKIVVKFVFSINPDFDNYYPIYKSSDNKYALKELLELYKNILVAYDLDKKKDTVIFVICYGNNLTEDHIKLDQSINYIQLFHINSLIFNISKHNLVPLHKRIEKKEHEFIKKKLYIDNLEKLPHILNTDPMAKYLGLKEGDVCKITRKTSDKYSCYRYCIEDPDFQFELTDQINNFFFLIDDFTAKLSGSKKSNKIIIKEQPKMGDIKNATITLTFAEQVENEKGNQTIGKKVELGEGINYNDLKFAENYFKENDFETELYNLRENLPNNESIKSNEFGDWEDADKPYILVIRNGAELLIGKNNIDKMFEEQAKLPHDHQSFQKGRVVTQHTRWNLCFADIDQKPDYKLKKGTVIKFGDNIPLTTLFRNNLKNIFNNDKAKNLYAEGNYYFDKTKCGIKFHGDYERRKVIAVRLGATIPIVYQWHYGPNQKALGNPISIDINHGDIYIMSEKAVGTDWKKQKIYTLRHAAGCPDQVTVDSKYLD